MKASPGTVPTLAPFQWTARLLDDTRVTRSTLLVALALATYGRAPDVPVWPSAGRLARQTGLSRQTVTTALGELRSLGYLLEADRRAYAAVLPAIVTGDQRVRAYLLTEGCVR